MRRLGWQSWAITAYLIAAAPASAYYPYTHYLSRTAPFTAAQEKYDLNALPNKTVTVYVSDLGPASLAPNDSFASVISQIKQATVAWNAVDTSDLRVAFGGLIQGNTTPNNPGVSVIFDNGDVPPGLLALTAHTTSSQISATTTGLFYPLQGAVMIFRRDLTSAPAPSYLDSFFTTSVHEMGHALGLQHTFTSSAMTVSVNRATNRSRPLDADDIAGISVLYPKSTYAASVGSITGRVTANGTGVALASVVALRANGAGISTLTAPDGTYRIDGLPQDVYYVYAHPIPPDADITLPLGPGNVPFPKGTDFDTVFFPNTRDLSQAVNIPVNRGAVVSSIDFAVRPRSTSALVYDGWTYSQQAQVSIYPAMLNIVFSAQGVFGFCAASSSPLPVNAQVVGVDPNMKSQALAQGCIALWPQFPLGVSPGPRHLVLNYGTDLYVLPSAVTLVQKNPPTILAVNQQGDGSVTVLGTNMSLDSRIFFDGLPATVKTAFNGSDAAGAITVIPPAGFSGQRSTVSVFNADGQSSLLLQSQNPPVFAYPAIDTPQIAASVASLPAGASSMVDIFGINTNFVDGQVTVGFGTSDIVVRHVWVINPNHAVANVSVLANAALSATEISVVSGFRVITQPFAFNTTPANPRSPVIALPVVNAVPSQTNLFPGGVATIFGTNLGTSITTASVTLIDANGVSYPAQLQFVSPTQVNFFIPANIPAGVATLRLNSGTDTAFPVAIEISAAPPAIVNVSSTSNTVLDATHPASMGDVLTLTVTGLDSAVLGAVTRLRVTASGVDLPVIGVQPGTNGSLQVQAVVTIAFGGQQVPLSVAQDGTFSSPVSITIR